MIVLSAAASCGWGIESPAQWTLDSGATLGSLFEEGEVGVVLVLDPAQVFTCANLLAQWLDWREEDPSRFALVLSRRAHDRERKRLAVLPVSGVLALEAKATWLPVELVLQDGVPLYQAARLGGVGTSELLLALRGQALSDAVALLVPE